MGHAVDYMPGPGEGGRPMKYTAEQVEYALWAMAQCGGSPTRAARMVAEEHPDWGIHKRTLSDWAEGRFRARYQEIRRERADELDELIAGHATDLAVKLSAVEEAALRRVSAGLADANGIEASMILRNLTQSKATQIERAGQLRGQAAFGPAQINLTAIVGELEALGVSRRRPEAVDGSAEETG